LKNSTSARIIETRWPGRLELIETGARILLDGAHNPGATEVLKKALETGYPGGG